MKRVLTLAVLLLAMYGVVAAQESFQSENMYFQPEELPDMRKWLPAPPAEGSAEFQYDIARHEWGKEQRKDKERAKIAIIQANSTVTNFCDIFSKPFGVEISEKNTPEIFLLIKDAVATCAKITVIAKDTYARPRPYMYFNEHTLLPEHEDNLRSSGSYPSGHTTRGWAAALILLEINPDAADALMEVGYMQGESRIIGGFHWQSDVTAARYAASVAVAKLHTSERFLRQMKRAKREFARIKKRN